MDLIINNINYLIWTSVGAALFYGIWLIVDVLKQNAGMLGGYLDKKGGHLAYSKLDTIKLFQYIYSGATEAQYLERKHDKFQKIFKDYRARGLA